jgi:hypothetical protein
LKLVQNSEFYDCSKKLYDSPKMLDAFMIFARRLTNVRLIRPA